MKTVEDAVKQENGVWAEDGFNAMARISGRIDYMRVDENGVLHYTEIGEPDNPASSDWKIVCTREEFEYKAREMGYVMDDSDKPVANQPAAPHQDPSSLLLAYLQGAADSGCKGSKNALEYYSALGRLNYE